MKNRAVVSVPGKLILMGEHAVVYGNPALVSAIGPRMSAELQSGLAGVRIHLPDFDLQIDTTWSEIVRYTDRVRAAWQDYAADPTPEKFRPVRAEQPSHLVTVALGELAADLNGQEMPGVSVKVDSRLPVGSGFGSSAAAAVAVIAGLITLMEEPLDLTRVDRLALEVERRQHGLPSGVDHKTVLYGGLLWTERQTDGQLQIDPFTARSPVLGELQVYQTGEPVETTGEVVAWVKRFGEEDPASFDKTLQRMAADVIGFRQGLVDSGWPPGGPAEVIKDYEDCLESFGVVPEAVRNTIREVEAAGGVAKISGAGALTGEAAGCLLVYWPDGPPDPAVDALGHYPRQKVELAAEGLRLEELS